jgi:tetratricopeptide (TPR) repeat protein
MTTAPAIELLYATGHWLLSRGRHREAAEVFQLMTLIAPGDERGWLALGACHEAVGQSRVAIELYRIALIVAAPAVRCTIARGRALRALDSEDAAIEAFDTAYELASSAGDAELAALAMRERRAS